MNVFDRCYKCANRSFYRNDAQVRCAKCGGFHCRLDEFHGRLLTRKQVDLIQKAAARKNAAERIAA